MQKSRNGAEGFTLIELMVLLALVGIVAAIAISGYRCVRSRSFLTEGPIGGGVRSFSNSYDGNVDLAASEQTPTPSPGASGSRSWVNLFELPWDSSCIRWHFPSPSPEPTETPVPPTTTPRATKRPASSPNTGGVPKTSVPTQETAPTPGVEPPSQGPPDTG